VSRIARAAILCGALLYAASSGFALGSKEGATRGLINGSGIIRTESRSVPTFTAIVVEGSGNVTLSQGNTQSLSVESDDNLLPLVKTEVLAGVLHLGFKEGVQARHVSQLEFLITVAELSAVTIAGSGNLHTTTLLHADTLSLEIAGTGGIYAELDVGRLGVLISGSGGITSVGKTDQLSLTISGSGSMQARDLVSGAAEITVNGSGEAVINAQRTISINVSGSGRVAYGGGAKATIKSSGSGIIQRF
jgi:hypothetical protein